MKLKVTDPIWVKIYSKLYKDFSQNDDHNGIRSNTWEESMNHYGITVARGLDLRVEYVILPRGDDLTLFLLRWG